MNLIPHFSKIILFSTLLVISCNDIKDFEEIDKTYHLNRTELIKKINSNKTYKYWEYVYAQPGHMYEPTKVLFTCGDSTQKDNYSIKKQQTGFFIECRPLACYSYIIYIDDDKVKYVVNEHQLEKFIGRIDNLEEALLISKIKGLWFDTENKKAGSFKETKNGYELNLCKFESCPMTKEAIRVKIDTLGNFKSESKGVYFTSTDCIME